MEAEQTQLTALAGRYLEVRALSIILFLLFSSAFAFGQTDSNKTAPPEGYSRIEEILLPEVTVTALPDLSKYDDRRDYYILRRKVLKVWPFAKEAAEQYHSVSTALEGEERKRKRKKYAKEVQRYMSENFKDTLKTLTRSEGVILVKLVNRETGRTTHEIIKEYRGGMSAAVWQSMAKLYDNNLKQEYDPVNTRDDIWIENILNRAFEAGIIERPQYPGIEDPL